MSPPPSLPEPPLPPRPPLSRLESVSSATLFFGPPIAQNPVPASICTNILITPACPDQAVNTSTSGTANRHSPEDLRAWKNIEARLPSPASCPDNTDLTSTDVDDDMDFDGNLPTFVLNVTADTPSPTKTILQSKYQPRDSGGVISDDDTGLTLPYSKPPKRGDLVPRSSTSVSPVFSDNDEGVVTPEVLPDSGFCWPGANVFVRGADDNGLRANHESLGSEVDVDAFIMNTLASAANGPPEIMKKIPGTPVKKNRTALLGRDRPWQSAIASKVGSRLDSGEAKAPRKSLPAVFPINPRQSDKFVDSSDSEEEQDSPSTRRNVKYGTLGLGRPTAEAPLALTRTRWLMRRSSSGAFSSGESASMSMTPTRNKVSGMLHLVFLLQVSEELNCLIW